MNINQTMINNFYTTLNDIMMLFLPRVTKHYFIYIYTEKQWHPCGKHARHGIHENEISRWNET